jgi:hypothetical protein
MRFRGTQFQAILSRPAKERVSFAAPICTKLESSQQHYVRIPNSSQADNICGQYWQKFTLEPKQSMIFLCLFSPNLKQANKFLWTCSEINFIQVRLKV